MSTGTLPVTDDAAGLDEMIRVMCEAVDSGDAATFASFFSDTALYRFGNSEPLFGRAAIEEVTAGITTQLPWVSHHIDQVAHVGRQLFCRFTISSANPAGRTVAMPCVTVVELKDGKIVDYRVHMDLAPVFGAG